MGGIGEVAAIFFWVNWFCAITIWQVRRSVITIRIIGYVPLQFSLYLADAILYAWRDVGPICRVPYTPLSSVCPILPPPEAIRPSPRLPHPLASSIDFLFLNRSSCSRRTLILEATATAADRRRVKQKGVQCWPGEADGESPPPLKLPHQGRRRWRLTAWSAGKCTSLSNLT